MEVHYYLMNLEKIATNCLNNICLKSFPKSRILKPFVY